MITRNVAQLVEFRFNEPENDSLMLRQHAAISGYRDALLDVLRYDDRIMAEVELRRQAQMTESSSQPQTPES